MAEPETQSDGLEDRLGNLLGLFEQRLEAQEKRTAAIEAAVRQLGEAAMMMGECKRAIVALTMVVSEILDGADPGSPLAELRKNIIDIDQLERMLRNEPKKDSST